MDINSVVDGKTVPMLGLITIIIFIACFVVWLAKRK